MDMDMVPHARATARRAAALKSFLTLLFTLTLQGSRCRGGAKRLVPLPRFRSPLVLDMANLFGGRGGRRGPWWGRGRNGGGVWVRPLWPMCPASVANMF